MKNAVQGISVDQRSAIAVDVGNGITVHVDFDRVSMSNEQRGILSRLLSMNPQATIQECAGDTCPAASKLSKDDFEKIRGLKATLSADDTQAGLICDFCLKCVVVG